MSKIRILTPEELEARDQQLSIEERNHLQNSELDSTDYEGSSAAHQPNQQSGFVSRNKGAAFEHLYPNIAHFVDGIGWIQIGYNDDSPIASFIYALDMGGMVWEGKDTYNNLDEAFQDLEQGLGEYKEE